jgi:3-hydroxyisobutyrate dehydrogenase-like beta-hydroxyacid dehydrogenase
MVGGERAIFERVGPYFEAMGKSLYYCGGSGMGLRAKLTQNLILGNLLQAFNEGLVTSTKAGVDPELMLDILNNSAARSGLISAKWLEKDLGLAVEFAGQMGIPVPLTSLTQQLLRAAIAQGYGEDDICGSIRSLECIAGVQVGCKQ